MTNFISHEYEKIPMSDILIKELENYYQQVFNANQKEGMLDNNILPMTVLCDSIITYIAGNKFKIEEMMSFLFCFIDVIMKNTLSEIKASVNNERDRLFAMMTIHNYFTQSIINNVTKFPMLDAKVEEKSSETSEADSNPVV